MHCGSVVTDTVYHDCTPCGCALCALWTVHAAHGPTRARGTAACTSPACTEPACTSPALQNPNHANKDERKGGRPKRQRTDMLHSGITIRSLIRPPYGHPYGNLGTYSRDGNGDNPLLELYTRYVPRYTSCDTDSAPDLTALFVSTGTDEDLR